MNFHQLSGIYFACQIVLLFLNCDRIWIQPSKRLLHSPDTSVDLNCLSSNWNKWTTLVFKVNGLVVYNSSEPNAKDPQAFIKNQTSISFTRISGGVINATCSMNETQSSNSLTIPYMSQLDFLLLLNPKPFYSRAPFKAKCTICVAPSATLKSVKFYVNATRYDRKSIATWSLNVSTSAHTTTPIFSKPHKSPLLDVAPGIAHHPTYTVIMKPAHREVVGRFSCQVELQVPGLTITADSNGWRLYNGGNRISLTNPFVILLLLAMAFKS